MLANEIIYVKLLVAHAIMNLFLHDVRVVSCSSHFNRTEGVKCY